MVNDFWDMWGVDRDEGLDLSPKASHAAHVFEPFEYPSFRTIVEVADSEGMRLTAFAERFDDLPASAENARPIPLA